MKIELQEHQKTYALMFSFAFAVLVFNWGWAEVIPANNGFGWDGFYRYKPLLTQPGDMYRYHYLDSYNVQRLIPWTPMWAIFRLFHIPRTDELLVFACRVYQSLMLITSVGLWCLISKQLKLNKSANWLGFVALFCSYCVLKAHFYYPVLTDSTAVVVGMLSFYFYLTNRFFSLFFVSVMSLMVWPTSLFYQSALLLFPYGTEASDEKSEGSKLRFVIASGLWLWFLYWFRGYSLEGSMSAEGLTPAITSLIPISTITACAYIIASESELFRTVRLANFMQLASKRTLLRSASVLVLLGVYLFLTKVVAQKQFALTAWDYAKSIAFMATTKPLGFLVSHVVYYGPFLLLIARYYGHFCQVVRRLGFGMLTIWAIMAMQMLCSETRQLANVFIYLVAPCAIMMQYVRRELVIKLCVCSLFMSHFWLPVNVWNSAPILAISYPNIGNRWDFPAQIYFMHEGCYMSDLMYFVHIPFLILVCFFLGLHKPLSAHIESNEVFSEPISLRLDSPVEG